MSKQLTNYNIGIFGKKKISFAESPKLKKTKVFLQADMNDFAKGITDLKVSYEPFFGHSAIEYRDHKNSWQDISKNILNTFAPKHSQILEMFQKSSSKGK